MQEIYKIKPLFMERIWGGHQLRDLFHYQFEKEPVGEAWLAGDLPLGSNEVEGTGLTLGEFYERYCGPFFGVSAKRLPIRITLIDAFDNLSVQLHPSDEYAQKNEKSLGKPEAWYVIKKEEGAQFQFGHHAKTKEEFIEKVRRNEWDSLLNYIDAEEEKFLYVDWGVLHAVGKGIVCYEVARNADVTYRAYDYGRIDKKTGKMRDLHVQQVLDNIKVPFDEPGLMKPVEVRTGNIGVTEYCDRPFEFTLRRIRCSNQGTYCQDAFGFYTIVRGEGMIQGIPMTIGETILVAKDVKTLKMSGDMDVMMSSYREVT